MYAFTFGSPDSKVDFLHIDNLVQAHHLAGEALLSTEAPAVGWVSGSIAVGSNECHCSSCRPPLKPSLVRLYGVVLEVSS